MMMQLTNPYAYMRTFALWTGLIFALNACVKPKLYRAEFAARESCESREKVLLKELSDRKTEVSSLTREIGSLNRTIGNQENEMRNMRAELVSRTQQMGASAEKIAKEKAALEQDFQAAKSLLEEQNAKLAQIESKRQALLNTLNKAANPIRNGVSDDAALGQSVAVKQEVLIVTLADKNLFDASGLNLSASGRNQLASLAEALNANPLLRAEIIAYTDNTPPKNIRDTWEWSITRALTITRTLVRDYNVNANQLSAVGRGEFYPLASNDTPEGRQRNRRTEVRITAPQQ